MKRKDFLSILGTSLISGAAFFTGCSNLLDQNNPNSVTPNNFWQNGNDAEANLTAVYQTFLGQAGWSAANNWYDRLIPALYRGDDIGITHDVPDWWSLANFILTDTNGTPNGMWNLNYQGIFRANQVIQNVPNIKNNIDPSLKKRYVGEAKFLRAYFYYSLITNFLNVPLITTVPKSSKDYNVAQAKPSQTWAQIEKDLNDAISVLPWSYDASNQGRVTKGAALGYLGKSQMFQQNWKGAVSTFEKIINSKNYQMMTNYWDAFLKKNDFNQEDLLEVNYASGSFKGQTLKSPRNFEEAPSEAGGWFECYPNKWLFSEMTKEKTANGKLDPRIYATIIWPNGGLKYYGQTYDQLFGSGATKMTWRKYNDSELDHHLQDYSGKNWRILRYSDILLMHAEALARLNKSSEAITYINMVRNRANLSNMSGSATQKQVLQEIEHQRIVELADEGNRWYDLLRWNGSIDGSMTIKQNLSKHGAIGAANFDPNKHKYLPIPQSEIQTNTKIKQNPGY